MRGRPIALQMLLVTIVTAVVLGLLLGTVVKELELSTLQKQLQRSSASTVAAVAAAAASAIVSEDVPVLQTVAKEVLESQAGIHQIIIENESGDLLAESRASDVLMEQSALVYSESVVYMGETFGSIQISWDIDQAISGMIAHCLPIVSPERSRLDILWLETVISVGCFNGASGRLINSSSPIHLGVRLC